MNRQRPGGSSRGWYWSRIDAGRRRGQLNLRHVPVGDHRNGQPQERPYGQRTQDKHAGILVRFKWRGWGGRLGWRREESPFRESSLELVCVDTHNVDHIATATLGISKAQKDYARITPVRTIRIRINSSSSLMTGTESRGLLRLRQAADHLEGAWAASVALLAAGGFHRLPQSLAEPGRSWWCQLGR